MRLLVRLSVVLLAGAGLALATGPSPATGPVTLVVCAPGYPGPTRDAQPTMDRLAAAVAEATGWTAVQAAYHPSVDGCRERLGAADAAVAIVPYALLWSEGPALDLQPLLQVVRDGGAAVTWALAAHRGRVRAPADLDGWEITGLPGFSPAFVRQVVLAGWGDLPAATRITFGERIVSDLRRAAAGEPVAVLLDPAQAGALPALPFAGDLEIVTRSAEVPGFVVTRVGDRLDDGPSRALQDALTRLHRQREGRETLESMRMVRFQKLDGPLAGGGEAPAAGRSGPR